MKLDIPADLIVSYRVTKPFSGMLKKKEYMDIMGPFLVFFIKKGQKPAFKCALEKFFDLDLNKWACRYL